MSNDATISMTLCFIGRYRNGWGRLVVSRMKNARNDGGGPLPPKLNRAPTTPVQLAKPRSSGFFAVRLRCTCGNTTPQLAVDEVLRAPSGAPLRVRSPEQNRSLE